LATVNEPAAEVVVTNDPSLLVKIAVTVWTPAVSPESTTDALPLLIDFTPLDSTKSYGIKLLFAEGNCGGSVRAIESSNHNFDL
jgi:hypothetical protein